MEPHTETHGTPDALLCRLAAHDGYGARADWQDLCPGQAPVQERGLDG